MKPDYSWTEMCFPTRNPRMEKELLLLVNLRSYSLMKTLSFSEKLLKPLWSQMVDAMLWWIVGWKILSGS
jgi:hypothetical protein